MNVTSKTVGCIGLNGYAMEAAREVGVRIYNPRYVGRNGFAFTLKTGKPSEMREDWRGKVRLQSKYQRLSQRTRQSTDRKHPGIEFNPIVPGAVCWHGHRAFLRAFYARVPDAKVRTTMATYLNREHFESTHAGTYYHGGDRMGYRILPYGDACTCAE